VRQFLTALNVPKTRFQRGFSLDKCRAPVESFAPEKLLAAEGLLLGVRHQSSIFS